MTRLLIPVQVGSEPAPQLHARVGGGGERVRAPAGWARWLSGPVVGERETLGQGLIAGVDERTAPVELVAHLLAVGDGS